MAMTHGISEHMRHHVLLGDLGIFDHKPMRLYLDDKAAISIAHTSLTS